MNQINSCLEINFVPPFLASPYQGLINFDSFNWEEGNGLDDIYE